VRYICIDRRRNQYPVRMMCRVLKVSRSGYYVWRVRPESQRAKTDRQLTRVIRRLHAASKGVYGSPKITDDLRDEGYRHGYLGNISPAAFEKRTGGLYKTVH
jgi:hypothetical protein